MQIFIAIGIITTAAGILFFLCSSIMIIRYIRTPYSSATIISVNDQRFNHGLIVYEYEINTGNFIKRVKGPQNINFSPFNFRRHNIGDIVQVKYASRINQILPTSGTILFYMIVGAVISLIGLIMLVLTSMMM